MNLVIIKGRLTKDVELRYTESTNKEIATFCVAVNRDYVKDGVREADFINCIAFNKIAQFISKYFQKGQEIEIVGRLQTRNYENKEGKKVYVTEIIVDKAEFVGNKKMNNDLEGLEDVATFVASADDSDLPF